MTSCSSSCTADNFLEKPGQQGESCSLLPPVARCFLDTHLAHQPQVISPGCFLQNAISADLPTG